jgi:hypothetical protein
MWKGPYEKYEIKDLHILATKQIRRSWTRVLTEKRNSKKWKKYTGKHEIIIFKQLNIVYTGARTWRTWLWNICINKVGRPWEQVPRVVGLTVLNASHCPYWHHMLLLATVNQHKALVANENCDVIISVTAQGRWGVGGWCRWFICLVWGKDCWYADYTRRQTDEVMWIVRDSLWYDWKEWGKNQ